MDYARISIKLVTAFFGLWMITKLLGKKEISQLTPFDFVSSLMLSELVGNTIYDPEARYLEMIFALVLWLALSLALEKIIQRFPWLSTPLGGKPDIIIRHGIIDQAAMRRNKLDMHQVGMLLREQSVFSIHDVAYAIFETNGSLSVMKKRIGEAETGGEPAAARDCLPCLLIDQGTIEESQLREIGREKSWLLAELKAQGFERAQDILYAEWSDNRGLHIQRR